MIGEKQAPFHSKPSMKFAFLYTVDAAKIPNKRHHPSVIDALPFWPEVEQILEFTAKNKIAPFENAAVIDLDKFAVETNKLKSPKLATIARLRMLIKRLSIENVLEVQSRGNQLYLVGV
jgi:hypothetical protein